MGAWGAGNFENDDALDWLAVLQAEGLPAAGAAIQDVLTLADDYLEAPTCCAALAAAEVIAALRGRPASRLPDELVEWLGRVSGDPGEQLATNARNAVDAIRRSSELRELWEDDEEWKQEVDGLYARLQ
jgi:uncharacterized protein DUF4259